LVNAVYTIYLTPSSREPITVVLEEGESVTIELASQLQPLPVLEGRVPEGWKEVIY
jgi:hypothetical protein